MSEPTRQQIKEAFKETIERWEKIVEDVSYFSKSSCKLCDLESFNSCNRFCPIANYDGQDHEGCVGIPWHDFAYKRTPENALAELNFLRKVYIWWIEKEKPTGVVRKEEKKEEWVDVTEEIELSLHAHYDGYCDIHFHLKSDPQEKGIGYIYADGNESFYNEDYKMERSGDSRMTFRILRKT